MAKDVAAVEESKDPSPVSAPAGVVVVQDEAGLDDYVSGEDDEPESSSALPGDFAATLDEVLAEVDHVFDQRVAQRKEIHRHIKHRYAEALGSVLKRIRDRSEQEKVATKHYLDYEEDESPLMDRSRMLKSTLSERTSRPSLSQANSSIFKPAESMNEPNKRFKPAPQAEVLQSHGR